MIHLWKIVWNCSLNIASKNQGFYFSLGEEWNYFGKLYVYYDIFGNFDKKCWSSDQELKIDGTEHRVES